MTACIGEKGINETPGGAVTEVTAIQTPEDLRMALGGPSTSSGVNTIRHRLHPVDIAWLRACGLWFIATGADCTPRGDQPGTVYVLDDWHIVLPERAGNRRGDSYANLLSDPTIGLLFVIPGRQDTLRISGRGLMISDAPWFDNLALDGTRPPLAIIVEIEKIFYHCVKAFQNSHLWEPDLWIPDAAPSRREVAAALRDGPLAMSQSCEKTC